MLPPCTPSALHSASSIPAPAPVPDLVLEERRAVEWRVRRSIRLAGRTVAALESAPARRAEGHSLVATVAPRFSAEVGS